MKKTKLLTLSLLPILCGCSLTSNYSFESHANNNRSMSLQSGKFKNYKLENFKDIEAKKNAIKNVVTSKGSVSDFILRLNDLSSDAIDIVKCYVIATTKYYANCDADYQAKADVYYDQYIGITKFINELEEDIYHSSNSIKKSYFGNLSDEAIEKKLQENQNSIIEADYDKVFNDYKDEGSELYLKFRQDGDVDYYLDTGYDYFLRYINKANELIEQIPYDDYLDYSYKNDYSRDYNKQNALEFVNYVKQYFIPLYKNKKALTKPNNVNTRLLDYIANYNFCNVNTNLYKEFTSYAEEMGSSYLSAYNAAFKNGYYCFSDSPNSMATAFQWGLPGENDAVLYFSSGYQDVLSVIHEFGHYFSCVQNGGIRKNDSYDLQETYSQGNEFTFCKYLLEVKKEDLDLDTYKYYVDDKIYSSLGQIINEAVITEIENFAYSTPNLTKESLINGVNAILATYDGTASETYFMAACLSSPCYYVSYATSLMEALQFASMSSFKEARDHYITLVEANGLSNAVARWENAGLKSPFGEECFTTLVNLFTSVGSKY